MALNLRVTTGEPVTSAMCVTEAAAALDQGWFADHPHRQFRARRGDHGVWLIRRLSQPGGTDAHLRTFGRTIALPADADGDIAPAWFAAAFPDWPAERCQRRAKKTLKREGRP
jgi:hypothetical protein